MDNSGKTTLGTDEPCDRSTATKKIVQASMFENRNLRFDLFTLLLLAATVLLAVALGTYNPADPPSTLVHPTPTEYHNACGPLGAYITHFLLESIGFGGDEG